MQQPRDATSRTYAFDVAISAATFDADIVADIREQLAPRLRTIPVWEGHAGSETVGARETLVADASRVAIVLHHRLWMLDAATQIDASTLRERLHSRPGSVYVITLDDTELPPWLATARRCALPECGVADAAVFALEAVAECGGSVRDEAPRDSVAEGAEPGARRWPEGPLPFLSQPRAQSALRKEFDTMTSELDTFVGSRRGEASGPAFDLLVLPFRLIARFDDRAITVSWVTGAQATVRDGRLMVIEWANVAPDVRGAAALKPAKPVREQVYHVEALNAESWRWRVDRAHGRAYATSHLVAEWVASVSASASASAGVSASA